MRLFTAFLATAAATATATTVSGSVSRPGTPVTAAYACRVDPSGNTSGPSADICDQVVRRWRLLTGTQPNPGEIRLISDGVPHSSDGGGWWTLEWLAPAPVAGTARRRKSDGLSVHYAQNILPHEAGHQVLSSYVGLAALPPDLYGTPAPDWIDEAAAVWMESRGAREQRMRSVVGTVPSLSKLALMVHPNVPLLQRDLQEPDARVVERTVIPPCPHCTSLPEEMRTKYRISMTTIGPGGKTKTTTSYSATDPDAAATAEQRGFYPLAYSLLRFIRMRGGVAAVRELLGRYRENPKPRVEVLLGLPGLPSTAASFESAWREFLRNPPPEDP